MKIAANTRPVASQFSVRNHGDGTRSTPDTISQWPTAPAPNTRPAATITRPNSSGVVLPSWARARMKAMSSFRICIFSSVIGRGPPRPHELVPPILIISLWIVKCFLLDRPRGSGADCRQNRKDLRKRRHDRRRRPAHPASLRHLALLREGAAAVRAQGPDLDLGRDPQPAAQARLPAADRRLSPYAVAADRGRCLLRHAGD